jgi:hypothetical protein
LKISNGSYKYNNLDTVDNLILTYSWIKFVDMPLFMLYVELCIHPSSIKVFNPSLPCKSQDIFSLLLFQVNNSDKCVVGSETYRVNKY